jgi:hypothetical protein
MRGLVAESSEVIRRGDETRAEDPLPHAVHIHACGERMLGIKERLCEGEPVGDAISGSILSEAGATSSPVVSTLPRTLRGYFTGITSRARPCCSRCVERRCWTRPGDIPSRTARAWSQLRLCSAAKCSRAASRALRGRRARLPVDTSGSRRC